MIIVLELVKSNVPCIVFDYTGIWSKIIRLCQNTPYQDNFLHFKLGSSFSIDIQHSGIEYDINNIYYLDLFYDVFALAFKEQKRNVEVLKETITKNENLDLTSITLDLQFQQKWEQPYYANSLLLLFKDFMAQGQVFSQHAIEYEEDINPLDFIRNDKTVIIDLSILKDLEKKTFVSFVILSKFIHFIENSADFVKKVIVMPHIDLFFDSYYIDTNYNTTNYGKIDKFLAPLLQNGFGLIYSANQVRYLHPHLFNYFRNIIALKATDARDIAVLKNQMNLQELQGTGYYSSKRNNTYQIEYLMNMKDDEIIVKRNDIYQPFPGIVYYDKLITTNHFIHEEILAYMEKQGYKLRLTERKILDKAKKTIFEKDLGVYIEFLDEIIHFLKTIKSIDNVGNLYKSKLKKELLKYITPKARGKTDDNFHIKEIRDELFDILLKHSYLIESHPRKASGSEALRVSYKVGSSYEIALQDYYNTQTARNGAMNVEVLEQEANRPLPFQRKYEIIQESRLKKALLFALSELFYQLFLIWDTLHKGLYEKTIKLEKDIIKKFCVLVYQQYYNIEKLITNHQLNEFFNSLNQSKGFPLNTEELEMYFKKFQKIEESDPKELFDSAQAFFRKMMSYLNKREGE